MKTDLVLTLDDHAGHQTCDPGRYLRLLAIPALEILLQYAADQAPDRGVYFLMQLVMRAEWDRPGIGNNRLIHVLVSPDELFVVDPAARRYTVRVPIRRMLEALRRTALEVQHVSKWPTVGLGPASIKLAPELAAGSWLKLGLDDAAVESKLRAGRYGRAMGAAALAPIRPEVFAADPPVFLVRADHLLPRYPTQQGGARGANRRLQTEMAGDSLPFSPGQSITNMVLPRGRESGRKAQEGGCG